MTITNFFNILSLITLFYCNHTKKEELHIDLNAPDIDSIMDKHLIYSGAGLEFKDKNVLLAYSLYEQFRDYEQNNTKSQDREELYHKSFYHYDLGIKNEIDSKSEIKRYRSRLRLAYGDYRGALDDLKGHRGQEITLIRGYCLLKMKNFEESAKQFSALIRECEEREKKIANASVTHTGDSLAEKLQFDLPSLEELVLDENKKLLAGALYYRGIVYCHLGEKKKACLDWDKSPVVDNSEFNMHSAGKSAIKMKKEYCQ